MKSGFSPSEVAEMVQAAQALRQHEESPKSIEPCNFRQAGQPSSEQLRALTALHEVFARSLGLSLAAQLRTSFEVSLGVIELAAFSEFVSKIDSVAYMATIDLPELQSAALLHIDHSVLFPVLDILMGGTGQAEIPERALTEIERDIVQETSKTVCRGLEMAWQPLGVSASLGHICNRAECKELMPLREKALILVFDITVAESKGKIHVVVPGSASNILFKKLSRDWSYSKPKSDIANSRLRNKLMNCNFDTALAIPKVKAELQQLMNLYPGTILNLKVQLKSPAILMVAGSESFESNPVRSGKSRAAQIRTRLEPGQSIKRD